MDERPIPLERVRGLSRNLHHPARSHDAELPGRAPTGHVVESLKGALHSLRQRRSITGVFDAILKRVSRCEQGVHQLGRDALHAIAHLLEQRFQLMRKLGDGCVAHRRAHPFNGVDAAEDEVHGLTRIVPLLQCEQGAIHR